MRGFSKFYEGMQTDKQASVLRDLFSLFYNKMREIVNQYDGIVLSFEGDGFFALFDIWEISKNNIDNKELAKMMIDAARLMIKCFNVDIKGFWKTECMIREIGIDKLDFDKVELGIGMTIAEATLFLYDPSDYQTYTALGPNINGSSG